MWTSWATDPDREYGGIRKGSAQAVMGNHEINAVAWHSSDPLNPGDFLRYHKLKKNMNQHRAFLKQVGGGCKSSQGACRLVSHSAALPGLQRCPGGQPDGLS